jgi:hypothetical protein
MVDLRLAALPVLRSLTIDESENSPRSKKKPVIKVGDIEKRQILRVCAFRRRVYRHLVVTAGEGVQSGLGASPPSRISVPLVAFRYASVTGNGTPGR